jgi:hypothetical protein
MNQLLKIQCVKGGLALESRGHEGHLHGQGAMAMVTTSPMAAVVEIKNALGWVNGKGPAGQHVSCKTLTGKSLHTWRGMIGKGCGEHFLCS